MIRKHVSRRPSARASELSPSVGLDVTWTQHFARLLPHAAPNAAPKWPADAFAVVASALESTGAYIRIVNDWTPSVRKWQAEARRAGREWRACVNDDKSAPREVQVAWHTLGRNPATGLSSLSEPTMLEAAMRILAAADEAFADLSLSRLEVHDPFELRVYEGLLRDESNLCSEVHRSCGFVLPKLHTPQGGLTLRSLSHHLAWLRASEVTPHRAPGEISPSQRGSSARARRADSLNLLLLPWPEELAPTQFRPVRATQRDMPKSFGQFRLELNYDSDYLVEQAAKACAVATRRVGRVDAIVMPECATRPGEAARIAEATGVRVIAGVGGAIDGRSVNRVEFAVPDDDLIAEYAQDKHHRWKLDSSQIVQYGLADQLDPQRAWWESFQIGPRNLYFTAISEATTLAVMICEDLARPDPAAEIIRAVGPGLVVALLLDGPQLLTRWPARYATVLEQDPGSSVLTLTSLGMALLSRRHDQPPSRVIALWKDGRSGPAKELTLPVGACGLLLMLGCEEVKEFTADGRHDQYPGASRGTSQLVYRGCHAIQT